MGEAVQRARRHWEASRRAAATEVTATPVSRPFTIAISRQAGAQGPAIARAVGERLGWHVYDRELLQLVADEMGLRRKLLESVDEKHVSWVRECLESLTTTPPVTENAYARHLFEMLFSLATHGECVIVGRGAAVVLPAETTLRVRLMGPRPERIQAIQQRFGISQEEAAAWVEKTDAERERFVKDHLGKDPGDPSHYDLVLNSSRFSTTECAELIIEALHRLQVRVRSDALLPGGQPGRR